MNIDVCEAHLNLPTLPLRKRGRSVFFNISGLGTRYKVGGNGETAGKDKYNRCRARRGPVLARIPGRKLSDVRDWG